MNRTTLLAAGIVVVTGVVVISTQLTLTKSGKLKLNEAEACTVEDDHSRCLPHNAEYVDVDGKFWTPDELADKVVMINFWATWCRPCLTEVPALAAVYSRYKDRGFVLLGVMMDQVSDKDLARFKGMTGLNYPIIQANENLNAAFDYPPALPMTFIYDKQGALQLSHRGPMSEARLNRIVSKLLDK